MRQGDRERRDSRMKRKRGGRGWTRRRMKSSRREE